MGAAGTGGGLGKEVRANPGSLLCPGHPGTRLSPYLCQSIPQVRGWGWCCVKCWRLDAPLPRSLPSLCLGDPHRAVAPCAAPPECRCLGLGSTGAAESVAPLHVLVRALCLSPPNCRHELLSTPGSTVGPLDRNITRMWQAVTWSLLCQDTPHCSLPPQASHGPGAAQGQQCLAPSSRAGSRPLLLPRSRSWGSPTQGQPQWRDVLCHVPGWHRRSD